MLAANIHLKIFIRGKYS